MMTASIPSDFEQVLASVAALSSQLTGRDGSAIRQNIQRLAQVLALDGPAAAVAALRAQLAEALGPPTAGDALCSEAERRAGFDREIQAAVDRIFRGGGAP